MNSTVRNLIALAFVTVLPSACFAGPHQLRRTVDDWDNRLYVQSPWMNGMLHVVPVIPLATVCAFVADFFVADAVTFWLDDAWGGTGTGFDHLRIETPDGRAQSLMIEGSGWNWVEIK
ncbi:MAG: hypothetical protein ABL997_00270 [Planctomycetota bacterium]